MESKEVMLFENVLDCGFDLGRKMQGRPVNGSYQSVLAIFLDGSTRTLSAIKLLHNNGFYEEGFSLVRVLLEISVDLQFINLNKLERAQQYIDFGKLKANEKIYFLDSIDDVTAFTQEKYDIQFEFKNKARWSQMTFKKMLEQVYSDAKDVQSGVILYNLLCGFSHSSTAGLGSTTVFTKEDIPIREKHREDLMKSLPVLSCLLVLSIYDSVNKEFSLDKGEQIEQLKTAKV